MSDTAKAAAGTDPRRRTREQIAGLIQTNPHVSVRDIAKVLDLSTQRIYQHTKALGLKQDAYGKWVSNGKGGGR